MRTMLLLVATLALGVSSASAQDTCIQGYQSCVQTCGGQRSQMAVNDCIGLCERKNDSCSEQSWGPRQTMKVTPMPSNTQARAPQPQPQQEARQPQPQPQAAPVPVAETRSELRNGVRVEIQDDAQQK